MSIIIKKINPNNDNLRIIFSFKEDIKIIITIANDAYRMCLLKNENSVLIEIDNMIPIVTIVIIIKKLNLSISFHQFERYFDIK